jgi:hypothetical protein
MPYLSPYMNGNNTPNTIFLYTSSDAFNDKFYRMDHTKNSRELSNGCNTIMESLDYTFGKLIHGCHCLKNNIHFDQILENQQNEINDFPDRSFKLKIPNKNLIVGINDKHIHWQYYYPFCTNNLNGTKISWQIIEDNTCTDTSKTGKFFRIMLDTNDEYKYMYASRDKGNIYLDKYQSVYSNCLETIYRDQQLWEIIYLNQSNQIYIFNYYRQQFLAHDNISNFLFVQDQPFVWLLI